jgi:hypothetical protein
MDGANALALLGLDDSATAVDVTRAFRAAALRSHPDHGGSRDDFELYRAAYVALKNRPPARRPSPFLNFTPTPVAAFDAYDATRTPRAPQRPSFADELRAALRQEPSFGVVADARERRVVGGDRLVRAA